MKTEIIEKVRSFVEEECGKQGSKYGKEPYEFHFVPMRNYAVGLAEKLGADGEVVELAAWLHDVGSIVNGREDHHVTGAKIAGKKLVELDYPLSRIEQIKYCIVNHRSSQNNNRETLEAQIISDADALSNFDNIGGIFKAAFVYEGQTQGQANASTRAKLQRKWEQLYFPESRELIKPKYDVAMLLL